MALWCKWITESEIFTMWMYESKSWIWNLENDDYEEEYICFEGRWLDFCMKLEVSEERSVSKI